MGADWKSRMTWTLLVGAGTGTGSVIYRLALSDEGVGTALQIGDVVGMTTVVVALIYILAVASWKSRGR